jgi:hypothetical protein
MKELRLPTRSREYASRTMSRWLAAEETNFALRRGQPPDIVGATVADTIYASGLVCNPKHPNKG